MRPFPRPNRSSLTALVAVTSVSAKRTGRAWALPRPARTLHASSHRRQSSARNHGQVVAAKFEHDTAPPVDGYVAPQLHTHAVVSTSLSGPMVSLAQFSRRASSPRSNLATAIYQSELTYKLRQLGYEITTAGAARRDKGYTQEEYLDASSPEQQIREYLERTGRSGKEAAEIAAHSTRDRKEIHSPGEVMAAHRKLAADFGHQADAVVCARELGLNIRISRSTHLSGFENRHFCSRQELEREQLWTSVR